MKKIVFILLGINACCISKQLPKTLEAISLDYVIQSFRKYPTSMYYVPNPSLDLENSNYLIKQANLENHTIKPQIQIELVSGFEDSVSIFINKKLLSTGFFISNYPNTNKNTSRMTYKTIYLNTKNQPSVKMTLVNHWGKRYFDTLINCRYNKVLISDDVKNWNLVFED